MRTPWVLAGLLLLAMAPFPAGGTGADATCAPGGPQVTATSGAGDPQLPTLVYAALKTGFRGVVVWETETAEIGRLSYSLNGGAVSTKSELVARNVHVFVLENLPIGAAVCFTPLHQDSSPAGSAHAFAARNAMEAHDGTAYTMNLLVLANEQSDLSAVEYGIDDFAELLYDATEGNVRAGRVIILAGDVEHHNAGWMPCVLLGSPGCMPWYDVIFTSDATPQGAASTYLDGIQDREFAIYMNWYHQAGLVNTGDDVGSVLVHEMGHYAFGMLDLYGGDSNCWDPANELSIMGGSREATEFDDEINRCPDEASIPTTYDPSYPRLRARFPLVPDRQGIIDVGPVGAGPVYARHTYEVLPQLSRTQVPPLPTIEQDDAGSGADAGSFVPSAAPIEAGILYEGTLLSPIDGSDMYRFDAPAGSTVEIAMYPRAATCFGILRPDGSTVPGSCTYDDTIGAHRTLVAPGGPLYLRFALGTSPRYLFGVGFDAPAPGPL